MLKIYILIISMVLCLEATQPNRSEDFTHTFSIRSVENGMILAIKRSSKDIVYNWNLREIKLNDHLKKRDRLRNLLPFGTVQFVDPMHSDRCLAIDKTGLFAGKSCKNDLLQGRLETVFSIMPTSTTAVQIRSLVLAGNECITTFENPHLNIGNRFGILPCIVDKTIPKNLLFIFTPPLIEATPLN